MNREQINYIKKNNSFNFPKIIQLEITDECPFNCPQCYKKSLSSCHADFEKLTNLIDFCYVNGTKLFVLNGGEPLLYNRFQELIQFLNKYQVEVNIFTSGYGIDSNWIEFWKKYYTDNFNFFISLNGSTNKINSLSRQGYDVAMQAIELFKENNLPYYINWVARKNNICDFPNMILLAEKFNSLGIEIIAEKLNGMNKLDLPLDKSDIMELAKIINNYTGKLKLLVEKCFPLLLNFIDKTSYSLFDGCFAGRMMCMYTLDNEFAPCTHLHMSEKFDTIMDYWNNSEIIKLLRTKSKPSICKDCKYTRCNFCKAMSLESKNDFSIGYKDCPLYEKVNA